MTAQINDTCFHRKIDFSLAGISGAGLFDPGAFGIKPVSTSTACWRGYVAHYSIIESRLFLASVHIGLPPPEAIKARAGKGPRLFGVLPSYDPFRGFLYSGLKSAVAFTGGLLLADEFIRELYIHMGFHPAWKYRNVREVIFADGVVVQDEDRSVTIADVRTKFLADLKARGKPLNESMDGDVRGWIEKCFSREYR